MSKNKQLQTSFTFWLFDANKQEQTQETKQSTEAFNQSLNPVTTFSTVQQFWAIFQYMKKPSQFQDQTDLYLFREGIKPLWEDPQNQRGGYFTIKIEKDRGNKIWENMVLALVAPGKSVMVCVNGVRMKAKEDMLSMQIWMNAGAQDQMNELKQYLKDCLQVTDEKIFMFFYFDYHLKKVKNKEIYRDTRQNGRERNREKGSSFYPKRH